MVAKPTELKPVTSPAAPAAIALRAVEDAPPRLGLREKRKIRTRVAIRRAAMRLFAEQGFHQTTVEQIARAAEVSHTTFFRYFQTKEQVVVTDDLEQARIDAIAGLPAGLTPFQLLRHLVIVVFDINNSDEWGGNLERFRLLSTEPSLRAAYRLEMERTLTQSAGHFARYFGHRRSDLEFRVFMAAVGGVLFHVSDGVDAPGGDETLVELLAAVDLLEQGLPL